MNFRDHTAWKSASPLFAEAGCLWLVYFFVVGLASAFDLGRPGSGYPGYLFFVAVIGALMAYHRSAARRAVCFVALLLALAGLHSEKSSSDAFGRLKFHLQTERMRRNYEQLSAESEAKAQENRPAATP